MRILIAHNYYQQPGGEDVVFEAEAALLESRGHRVTRFVVRNDQIDDASKLSKLRAAASTLWGGDARRRVAAIVREQRIEVAHFHNTFPLISPAALGAARAAGAAVVQTLHNHRLVCPSGVVCRDGRVCEKCVGKHFAWPGVVHGCYRGSRAATAAVALMQVTHRAAGTWRRDVDLYLAPSHSTRDRLCGAGLPPDRVRVKPHFVDPDPGPGDGGAGYAVFVGRLSEEKGLPALLRAWELLPDAPLLKIVGDGPLADSARAAAARAGGNVQWLGRLPMRAAYDVIGSAAALVLPSQCHETFGRVIAEAYAKGTPVVASNLGAAPEMVTPGVTGFLFEPGSAGAIARCVAAAFSSPGLLQTMRRAARQEYEGKYHAQGNYQQLLAAYERALASRHAPVGAAA